MGVYLDLIPYSKAKWPAKGPVVYKHKNTIEFVKAFHDIADMVAREIPRRVALLDHEGDLVQTSPYGDVLRYATAGKLADGLAKAIKAGVPAMINAPERWTKGLLAKLRRLKRSNPVLLYYY